jgi:hypothetical protein
VDFEVGRSGGVRLYTFYNGEVTDGPQKGQKLGPYTYIYRVDKETFTEVMGFIAGQEKQAPALRTYKRAKETDAPKAPAAPTEKQS